MCGVEVLSHRSISGTNHLTHSVLKREKVCENYVTSRLKLNVNYISEICRPDFHVVPQNIINESSNVISFVYIRSNFLTTTSSTLQLAYKINSYSNIRFPLYSSGNKAWKLNFRRLQILLCRLVASGYATVETKQRPFL
jgi:hypothetical protein